MLDAFKITKITHKESARLGERFGEKNQGLEEGVGSRVVSPSRSDLIWGVWKDVNHV